jgi:hypothetical protein
MVVGLFQSLVRARSARRAPDHRDEDGYSTDDEDQGDGSLVDPLAPVPPISNRLWHLLPTANSSMRAEPACNGGAPYCVLFCTVIDDRDDHDDDGIGGPVRGIDMTTGVITPALLVSPPPVDDGQPRTELFEVLRVGRSYPI